MSFLQDGSYVEAAKFPFLKDLASHYKKKIKTSLFFNFEDATDEVISEIEGFFQHTSLKSALKERFGISSSKVTAFVQENLFSVEDKFVLLNLNYYLALDVLSFVFLKQETPNHNAVIKLLENHKVLSILAPLYNHRLQVQKFLNDNFTEDQKLSFLESSGLYDEPLDTLSMYFYNDDYCKKLLGDMPVKDKDSFRKVHDKLAKEMEKLKAENFPLKQETFFPKIKSLSQIIKNYTFVVPQTHYDLVLWGQELGHCIGSHHYAQSASMGHTLLLGVATGEKIKYTLEIRNQSMVQIQGKSGTRPGPLLLGEIRDVLIKHGLLKKDKK